MALVVLGLDAADLALAQRWQCENLLLKNYHELESFAHSRSFPITTEVWPTVATGRGPDDHGLVANGSQQSWDHPLLRAVSPVVRRLLPVEWRRQIGDSIRKSSLFGDEELSMKRVDGDHAFEDGAVYGWPGLTDAKNLLEAWNLLARFEDGELDDLAFLRALYGNAGEELGWAMAMAKFGTPLVGVHLHVLDAAGHAYAAREDQLRQVYEDVDTMVGAVRSAVDALVVCSDHGMTVEWLDDEPGEHSWRAMFATTEEGDLPGSVFDIREWLERHAGPDRRPAATGTGTAISRAQLEALGYVDS